MCENGIGYGLIVVIGIFFIVLGIPFLCEKIRYYWFCKKCTKEFVDSLIQNGKLDIYYLAVFFGVDSATVRIHLLRLGYCVDSVWVWRVEK